MRPSKKNAEPDERAESTQSYTDQDRTWRKPAAPKNSLLGSDGTRYVMIGDYGETVVIDWGLAKDWSDPKTANEPAARVDHATGDDVTVAGQDVGTPEYMSPEPARGEGLNYQDTGDIHLGLAEIESALDTFRKALVIARKLAEQDPTNPRWQNNLASSYLHTGRVLKAEDDSTGEREFFGACARTYATVAEMSTDFYQAAVCSAQEGDKTSAFEWLEKESRHGWSDVSRVGNASDLASLRSDPRWKALLQQMPQEN